MGCGRCNLWLIKDNRLRSDKILQRRYRGEMPTIDLVKSRKVSITIMNRFHGIFGSFHLAWDLSIFIDVFIFLESVGLWILKNSEFFATVFEFFPDKS